MKFCYPGSELELFSTASRWKQYVAALVAPYVAGPVLDVGAGIGAHVPYLFKPEIREWLCLEPDQELASRLTGRIVRGELPSACRVFNGVLDQLDNDKHFRTILYFDVLEHVSDDRTELANAAGRLSNGGALIVLAPAHQFLFSEFDRAIGHYRRYGSQSLKSLAPPECRLVLYRMLDSLGFFASLANRLILHSETPTPKQIRFWDQALVPLSRHLDRYLRYQVGKSVLAVWRMTATQARGCVR